MKIESLAEVCFKPLGDKGEDAYAYHIQKDDMQTIAVFDGCGGSGSWKYPEFKSATGAFVAAQSISKFYLSWFESLPVSAINKPEALCESFEEESRNVLIKLKQSCAPMGISGSLVKSFPCTASVAVMVPNTDGSITLTALNAGDSRVYYMTGKSGLVQFTKDDSRGNPDPLVSLRESPALSNLLNADKPYKVVSRQITIHEPCAIITATDGVFGFVRSPMDFEYMLLNDLMMTDSLAAFEEAFKKDIMKLTGDDSVCLIAFYGWSDYQSIKQNLLERYRYIEKIIGEINAASSPEAREAVILEAWNTYRKETVFDELQV